MSNAAHLKHLTWGKQLVFTFENVFDSFVYSPIQGGFFPPSKYCCSTAMQVIAFSYMFKVKG